MADEETKAEAEAEDLTSPIEYGSAQPGQPVKLTPAQQALAGGPAAEPKTVAMDVLRDGSFNGAYHHAGDSIDVDEQYAETLTLSGFAARKDRVEEAQKARDLDAKRKAAKEKGGRRSTAVAPLGTGDLSGAEPPKTE